jgi:hypothetical protein
VGVEAWTTWDRLGANLLAWLLTYALHSTVLIGGAWLVALALARVACRVRGLRDLLPPIRERLWKTALVGGIVTGTAQSHFHVGPWQMRFTPDSAPLSALASSAVDSTPGDMPQPGEPPVGTARLLPAGPVPVAVTELEARVTPAAISALSDTTSWIGLLLSLWAFGAAIGLARWICQWNRLLRELDDRTEIRAGPLFDALARLREASGSKASVTLCSAPGIAAPLTLGLRRAQICVPPRVEADLRREEITSLLAHELAHVERRDPAWLLVCRAVEAVFFFQPLNRLCAAWLSDEAEYMADDWAVEQTGERVGLASCLTEIAGWMVQADESRLVAGMAARGTRLSLRVGRLLDEDHEPAASARGTWMTGALAPFGLSAALLVPGVTTADGDPRPAEGLEDRTSQLEVALAAFARNVGAPLATSGAREPDVDLDGVLLDLEHEIERQRDQLSARTGGESLRSALDGLEQRVAELRARACTVQARLSELTTTEWKENSDAVTYPNVFVFDSVSKD